MKWSFDKPESFPQSGLTLKLRSKFLEPSYDYHQSFLLACGGVTGELFFPIFVVVGIHFMHFSWKYMSHRSYTSQSVWSMDNLKCSSRVKLLTTVWNATFRQTAIFYWLPQRSTHVTKNEIYLMSLIFNGPKDNLFDCPKN